MGPGAGSEPGLWGADLTVDAPVPVDATVTGREPTVLVVDDDRELADTYASWLWGAYDVRTAYGGEAALEALGANVDVALLDRRMPGVPGDHVLDAVRERGCGWQVAMLTAVEPDSDVVGLPFDDYLVKPVGPSALVATVDELCLRADLDAATRRHLARSATDDALGDRHRAAVGDTDRVASVRDGGGEAETAVREEVAELEALTTLVALVRSVDRAVVAATGRAEVEAESTRRLVAEGPYAFAWVGGRTGAAEALVSRATSAAGAVDEGPLEGDASHPAARALETGTVVVDAGPVAAPDGAPDAGPVAAVPLAHEDTVYGALVVHAPPAHEFVPRETTVLGELGDTVANAVSAAEREHLLRADAVVELDLRVPRGRDTVIDLAGELDGDLTLDAVVPAEGEGVVCHLAVAGAGPDAVRDAFDRVEGVAARRAVDARADGAAVRVAVDGPAVVGTLQGTSAVVRGMTVGDAEGTVTAALAPQADPRTVLAAVEREFPGVELAAKRTRQRGVGCAEGFSSTLDERLTDRQRSVLESAHEAGYFRWPRGSTAEEVAEGVGVAPATLHEHLREAQRKLIETFLDDPA